jgi:hypothetical protein
MLKISFLLWLTISFWCVSSSSLHYKKVGVDSVFIDWNKATFQSLKRQLQLSPDSGQKAAYLNRLSAIEGFLGVRNLEDINVGSLRYKFLEMLFTGVNAGRRKFYIVESNRSGDMIELRNFVIYIDSAHKADIKFYVFVNGKWNQRGGSSVNNFFIDHNLRSYIVKAHGFNNDDVIATKFENNQVDESEYYLNGTLSISSGIKVVLDTYNTKNFK